MVCSFLMNILYFKAYSPGLDRVYNAIILKALQCWSLMKDVSVGLMCKTNQEYLIKCIPWSAQTLGAHQDWVSTLIIQSFLDFFESNI